MFRGHSYRNQDDKGRLSLPPEFRDEILGKSPGGKLVLTNFDQCVLCYPLPEWESLEQSFGQLNQAKDWARKFHRFFIAAAVEVALDRQNRILIPPHLRNYAGLYNKQVVVAGVGKKIEIWDQEKFEAQRAEVMDNFEDMMTNLADNGIDLRI